jgi:hypothetical protein
MVLSAHGHKAYVEASYEDGWMTYYFHCIDIPKESYESTASFEDALYDASAWLRSLPSVEQALSDEAFEEGIIRI